MLQAPLLLPSSLPFLWIAHAQSATNPVGISRLLLVFPSNKKKKLLHCTGSFFFKRVGRRRLESWYQIPNGMATCFI